MAASMAPCRTGTQSESRPKSIRKRSPKRPGWRAPHLFGGWRDREGGISDSGFYTAKGLKRCETFDRRVKTAPGDPPRGRRARRGARTRAHTRIRFSFDPFSRRKRS
eukprot:286840-Prorocentrum_minimum.AAC.1